MDKKVLEVSSEAIRFFVWPEAKESHFFLHWLTNESSTDNATEIETPMFYSQFTSVLNGYNLNREKIAYFTPTIHPKKFKHTNL